MGRVVSGESNWNEVWDVQYATHSQGLYQYTTRNNNPAGYWLLRPCLKDVCRSQEVVAFPFLVSTLVFSTCFVACELRRLCPPSLRAMPLHTFNPRRIRPRDQYWSVITYLQSQPSEHTQNPKNGLGFKANVGVR